MQQYSNFIIHIIFNIYLLFYFSRQLACLAGNKYVYELIGLIRPTITHISFLESLRLFSTTETLENAIAPAAIAG